MYTSVRDIFFDKTDVHTCRTKGIVFDTDVYICTKDHVFGTDVYICTKQMYNLLHFKCHLTLSLVRQVYTSVLSKTMSLTDEDVYIRKRHSLW